MFWHQNSDPDDWLTAVVDGRPRVKLQLGRNDQSDYPALFWRGALSYSSIEAFVESLATTWPSLAIREEESEESSSAATWGEPSTFLRHALHGAHDSQHVAFELGSQGSHAELALWGSLEHRSERNVLTPEVGIAVLRRPRLVGDERTRHACALLMNQTSEGKAIDMETASSLVDAAADHLARSGGGSLLHAGA